ncbi:MAG: class I SAM-dependent methyltransferase [Deltaproteobacteria bacterium]
MKNNNGANPQFGGDVGEKVDWGKRAHTGFLASGIDPADRKGRKNRYIDLLQKMALEEVLELKGDEAVLDFGCGSGRISYWIASRVKKVVGLEVTPEMIDLAKQNRDAENVEFMLYDGIHFPVMPHTFDLVLSVGVLQIMEGENLTKVILALSHYLKSGGRFLMIEQVSDNPGIKRPSVNEYLHAFKESGLDCLQYYPIRKGRWWLLYLIRYGLISERYLSRIALWEMKKRRKGEKHISYYWDGLFLTKKI